MTKFQTVVSLTKRSKLTFEILLTNKKFLRTNYFLSLPVHTQVKKRQTWLKNEFEAEIAEDDICFSFFVKFQFYGCRLWPTYLFLEVTRCTVCYLHCILFVHRKLSLHKASIHLS